MRPPATLDHVGACENRRGGILAVASHFMQLQQSELVQVGDVFDDELGRNVWDVFVRADFRLLHRRAEAFGRCQRSA